MREGERRMATTFDRAKLDTGALDIKPLTPAIGAEIHGIDLGAADTPSRIPEIRAALLKYGVIFFRDQDLTQEQHIAFAREFGELEVHPATPKDQPNPEVLRIAHGPKSRGQENNWHSDVTWREKALLGLYPAGARSARMRRRYVFCQYAPRL